MDEPTKILDYMLTDTWHTGDDWLIQRRGTKARLVKFRRVYEWVVSSTEFTSIESEQAKQWIAGMGYTLALIEAPAPAST